MNTILEKSIRKRQSTSIHVNRGAMNRYMKIGYILSVFASDFLMLGVALRLAYWARFELKLSVASEVIPFLDFYRSLSLVIICGTILLFALIGLYNWDNLLGGTYEYFRISQASTIMFFIIVLSTFIFPDLQIARGWLFGSWIFSMCMAGCSRFVMRRIVYCLREHGYFQMPSIVIGSGEESLAIARELSNSRSGYRILGLVDVNMRTGNLSDKHHEIPSIGSLIDLESIVQRHGIKELIVPASSLHREDLMRLYERVHGIPDLELRLSTGLFELLTTGVRVQTAGWVPLIGLRKLRLEPMEIIIKTAFEWTLTLIGLLVLLPFMILIALAIRLESPGPAIYRRRVVGVGGKEFDAFKFRTMHVDSDEMLLQNPELAEELKLVGKLRDDPRITRLGRWLRRFSVDELPQLLNVCLGQMSLVGPRMIHPEEVKIYGRNRFNLFAVKPGITGLWQVTGRSDISYEDRIRLDMYYVRNYSLWLDMHILFMTAGAVISGRGAY